jgi:hypothetical protein
MSAGKHDCTGKGMDAAVRSLTKSLGADAEVFSQESAIVPGTDRRLVRVTGAAAGKPNTIAQVVVDDDGAVVDLAALEASIGRPVFVPDIGEITVDPHKPARVTISPTSNDFTLECCQEWAETIKVAIPKSGAIPKADVYLLADTTASMTSVIAAVKGGIPAIVSSFGPGFDVAFGVGNYKDFPNDPYCFQHQLSPTTTAAQVNSAVSTWSATGGSDGSEGQFFALHKLAVDTATIGWRPGARRIVVWFGDFPGHDPICPTITGGLIATPITEASIKAELAANNVTVVAISVTTGVPGGLDADPVPFSGDYAAPCGAPGGSAGQATRITAATGGSHTTGINAGTIVATLTSLIAAAVTKTGNVSLVPSPGIAGFVESITPPGGYGPLAGDVPHDLAFEVLWKGTVKCAGEPQVSNGTLDVVADGVVVARKAVRITIPACRYHHTVEFLCGTRRDEGRERCETVVPGRYATAVTIYNPTACTVEIEKRFAPLLLRGEALGREPNTVPARTYDKIRLGPGEATMDDCCNIAEAFGSDGEVVLGVLDVVASAPVEVIAVMTATDHEKPGGAAIHTRHVAARRDCCAQGCCK